MGFHRAAGLLKGPGVSFCVLKGLINKFQPKILNINTFSLLAYFARTQLIKESGRQV